VSCNFALHQLPTEDLASSCLRVIGRARQRTGCAVWIFDFARLRDPRSWPAMMSMLDVPGPLFREDGIASERAAFTQSELTTLLEHAGLSDLGQARSRPLGEYQAHWAPGHDRPSDGTWHDVALPRGIGLASRIFLQSFPRSLTRP